MKFAAITLVLATLALANPAPAADAQIETPAQFEEALAARDPSPAAPEIVARAAGIQLAPRSPKKPKVSNGNNKNNTDSAAGTLSPSKALGLGALGLGVMEVVRLW
ncbi:hypothetical protein EJ04DRAFT_514958 [Polyplosphaeria fusca]|uniref:Uncharacterized protein n=1 Tax=Polyplosphaeria fusca TaxID=682080 RepID=A0A9P4QTY5_9PLEO|nr:hypothetical protein EJ04DRAFT_514958 [Polyplosphaeria fusca]